MTEDQITKLSEEYDRTVHAEDTSSGGKRVTRKTSYSEIKLSSPQKKGNLHLFVSLTCGGIKLSDMNTSCFH